MSEAGTSAPGREPDTRHWMLEAAGVAVLVAAVHILCRLSASFLVGALNDDGVYVVLGKAIARGEGYRSIHLAAAPVQVRYPPGFPLLLAIPWALGGSLDAVRATVAVANVLATSAAAGLVWWIGRRDLGVGPWPLAVCAVSAFVLDGTIQYFNIPLTEPYFVLGWAAALVLARPLFDPGGPGRWSVTRAAGVGLVLAATTLFRTAAVGLLPAMLVALALHRRWRAAAACGVGGVLPMVTWATLRATWVARGPVSSVPDDLGYWRWLGVDGPFALAGLAGRTIFTNAVEYVPKLASYLFSSQPVGIGIVGLASVAVAVACAKLWREHTALVATTLSASALTLLWPYAQGRLLLPLLPFLGLLAAATVGAGSRHLPRRVAWGATAALGLTALAVTLRQIELREAAGRAYWTGAMRLEDRSPALTLALRSRFIGDVTGWVSRNTNLQDRVMVDAPAAVYLYTGRRTVPGQPTESRLASSVFGVPGRYLAERILADSIAVVVWAPPASQLEQDILAVEARCPGVLARERSARVMYFRVTRDEICLRQKVLQGGVR